MGVARRCGGVGWEWGSVFASEVGVRPEVFSMFDRIEYSRLAVSEPKLYEDKLKEKRLGSEARSVISTESIESTVRVTFKVGLGFVFHLRVLYKGGIDGGSRHGRRRHGRTDLGIMGLVVGHCCQSSQKRGRTVNSILQVLCLLPDAILT